MADKQGRTVAALVEDAVLQYVRAATLRDVTAADVAATQEALLGELTGVPGWAAR